MVPTGTRNRPATQHFFYNPTQNDFENPRVTGNPQTPHGAQKYPILYLSAPLFFDSQPQQACC